MEKANIERIVVRKSQRLMQPDSMISIPADANQIALNRPHDGRIDVSVGSIGCRSRCPPLFVRLQSFCAAKDVLDYLHASGSGGRLLTAVLVGLRSYSSHHLYFVVDCVPERLVLKFVAELPPGENRALSSIIRVKSSDKHSLRKVDRHG